MKALDLFCGAGGASMGLHLSGFNVTGVDTDPKTSYPFEFHQGDALKTSLDRFDFVWASPPCQAFTAYKRRPDHVAPCSNLIPAIREKLQAWGGAWVIENVPGAPLENPFQLCGSSFGLDVRRHRIFESSVGMCAPSCDHSWQTPRFAPASNRTNLRSTVEVGVWRVPLAVQQRAMGIDWMGLKDLSQAVPPAYAKWIGLEAIKYLRTPGA